MSTNKKYSSINDIKGTSVRRLVTGLPELNWIYGNTNKAYGIPEKTISLWSGPSGTGKSRLAIKTIKSLFSRNENWKILYFQGEVPLENFASYVGADSVKHRNLFVSDVFTMADIESSIKELRPHIVLIDSVNKVYDFKKHGGDYIIDGSPEDNIIGLKSVCNKYDVIIIMLGQVNQNGSNKGGTSLTHAVDIHLSFLPVKGDKDKFRVEVGEKQRYGKRTPWAIFGHNKDGVFEVTENRYYDKDWCNIHGISVRSKTDSRITESANYDNEDLANLRKSWEKAFPENARKSQKPTNLPEVDKLNKGLEALAEDQRKNTPVVNRSITPNTAQKSNKNGMGHIGDNKIPIKNRGFFNRLLHKAYKNYMYGCSSKVNPMGYDYARMLKNGDLEFEDMIHVHAYQQMVSSPEYQQQQLADRIAENQEALERRKISQAMTWLVPRFEEKLDQISDKLGKK